jgi:hypothetical protein
MTAKKDELKSNTRIKIIKRVTSGLARKLLDWKPMGTRQVGRPRQRWQEDVTED